MVFKDSVCFGSLPRTLKQLWASSGIKLYYERNCKNQAQSSRERKGRRGLNMVIMLEMN